MKNFFITFLVLFLSLNSYTYSQITIDANDMPTPKYIHYVCKNNIFFDITFDYKKSGENLVWDVTKIKCLSDDTVEYLSPKSTELPFICQAVFNNPFNETYKATVALINDNFSSFSLEGLEISNVYEYYKNSSSSFTTVGRSLLINQIPFCIKNEPPDVLYQFPLTYKKEYNSNSKFTIKVPEIGFLEETIERKSEVDAWGTVKTNIGEFNTIRVKSTLNIVDTFYYNNYGMKIKRTETHYTWLSKEKKIPILKIIDKGIFGGINAIWIDVPKIDNTYITENYNNIILTSNPTNGSILLKDYHSKIILINSAGKKFIFENTNYINIENFPDGLYLLIIPEKNVSFKMIKIQ